MKNERVALNLNELETVAGGAEYNYDLFDPEDKLTKQQMELGINKRYLAPFCKKVPGTIYLYQ